MKKKPKKVTEYLPKDERLMFIQGRVPESIAEGIKRQLEKLNWSWNDYFRATGLKFLDEMNEEA